MTRYGWGSEKARIARALTGFASFVGDPHRPAGSAGEVSPAHAKDTVRIIVIVVVVLLSEKCR
jgi:hypothetical protein